MGILSKWFGNSQPKAEQSEKVEKNEIWMRLSVSQNGNSVSIKVHGLETVNVCLASFLTKGVSYAQEKYNEYKQSPKSEAEVEISESIMAALKEVAHNDARKGCKPIKRERESK